MKNISTPARAELLRIDALLQQLIHARNRNALHALHDHHLAVAPVPEDFRDEEQRRPDEIAPELGAVRGLAREIELVVDGAVELGDDLARFEALAIGPELLHHQCAGLHQREVLFDRARDVGTQNLDRGGGSIRQGRQVHLGDRRACDGRAVESPKDLVHGPAIHALQCGDDLIARKRRNAILQPRKLVGDVGGQKIATRREHLSELDEDRSQLLKRQAQALRARRREVAPEGESADGWTQPVKALVAEQELVEPVLERDAQDLDEPKPPHAAIVRDASRRRAAG